VAAVADWWWRWLNLSLSHGDGLGDGYSWWADA
jgi:hypothetical protein